MGSHMRLEHCSAAHTDPGVKANIPEHAAVRTGQRDLLNSHVLGLGFRLRGRDRANVQLWKGVRGLPKQNAGCKEHKGAAKSTKRLQRALCSEKCSV